MAHSMSLRTARTVAGLVGAGLVAATLTAVSAAAVVDPIVGDWNVTYGAPAVVTMTLTNGVYTETAATPVRVAAAYPSLSSRRIPFSMAQPSRARRWRPGRRGIATVGS